MSRKTILSLVFMFMILMALLLASCSYLSIPARDDVAAGRNGAKEGNAPPVYNSAVIKGRIAGANNRDATLIIAYNPATEKKEYTEYVASQANAAFMLYLPEGRYHLYAVTDFNHNGIFENHEVSGVYGANLKPAEIHIREGELITGITIRTVKGNSTGMTLPLEWHSKKDQPLIRQITHNGQVLKIYHEYFSLENAQGGYWNPSAFMKAFGAHIYLTQAYDPRKIPILFVHGTEGSPQNWIYFYMRLDLNRYQPWFFYYPSGIRLPLAAALLNEELHELHQKFGFQIMAVVAHSVGGLTTRALLTRYSAAGQNDFIKLFVSLATPWSGFGMADASQTIVHKSIPAWIDMGTQSDFITTTLQDRLPENLRHYIFYGRKDELSGAKALDERAVSCAVKTFGFDCNHDTILSDRKVFKQFNAILEKELR